MSRWQPDSRRRLEEAAFSLYAERGFENTTAAQIAERAGVTDRTFFRHFGDKREVLFGNEAAIRALLRRAVEEAPATDTPLNAVATGLQAVGEELQPRRDAQRQRALIISSHPELQERELIKQMAWSADLAGALRERGVSAPDARLAAEVAIALLRVAFERWIEKNNDRELPDLITDALGQIALFAADR